MLTERQVERMTRTGTKGGDGGCEEDDNDETSNVLY